MKKSSLYKSAMTRLKTSEDFNEVTYQKLMSEIEKAATPSNISNQKERMNMQKTVKRTLTGWTVGIAACAVLVVGGFALTQNSSPSTPAPSQSTNVGTKPPIMGKVAVNIDGVISEVSADGASFKVGDLWVTVTDQTKLGSTEPTAAKPSDELLNKDFKVGDIVSGYTSQDVSTGKVNADVIYNLIAPQNDAANANATKPATTGKMAANIDGQITEVSADGKSFKVGDLWVTVTSDTIMGISGPTAAAPSDDLLQKEFKVGNFVSGFTTDDIGTGKVTATRIYNNMAPQQ
ncbi:hypothetical protein GZH47_11795 [Paenibacillus rhizovicinus]|uniref:DUF5666 domain-containing protein n=1 Tax=Paenibacillus rhizovicinus TaxID=2704463 RepID=A0A6C0NZT2_9BACL|nr:DUF5666 domain-containing protein [Paenibacillus rhizovicinus]QHW31456.1 hypothetical protein GZH47_11795 [Paenibacillus rhizovicinus]